MREGKNQFKSMSALKHILIAGLVLLIVLNIKTVTNAAGVAYKIFYPLILGAMIAYVLNLLIIWLNKLYFPNSENRFIQKSRKIVTLILSLVTVVLVVFIFTRLLIPKINEFFDLLIKGFPVFYDKLVDWFLRYSEEFPIFKQWVNELDMSGESVLRRGLEIIGDWAGGTVSVVGSIFGSIFNIIVGSIFSIYILASKDELINLFDRIFKAYLSKNTREKFYYVLDTANLSFSQYFIGQFKEAVILGVLCTLGMLAFGFPYSSVIGPVIGLTALIPMVGAYIGAGVGFLLIVIVDPVKALFFILFIAVLQQLEGNVIYPKVVGKSVGLPGIWVFAAVMVGGGLMGIPGILLGVPIFATAYKLMGKAVNDRIEAQ
ncbi:AI-2E family transporter [Alkalibacter mobilis]|uniref:AI-2E family transporter n=1 Tax=Alkalibacter mobilis TaxID=2787712 RepID=UPI00189CAB37|nr:AI-2E family transporter [Alkalibacter mobilis]MBF7096260.1 AI-2E family transporter [Alkalibacter mobilis]